MQPPVVHLVGAGPGDADLLTLRAARLLQLADVVVHDRLIGAGVHELTNPTARRIDVGKAAGRHALPQAEINELLVELAAPDRVVVRLKGGDPFVFGRGGEEVIHLLRHGIRVEVVPGITAAAGCAAAAGIPLTHRGIARSVRFVTGHCKADEPLDLDWAGLADPETTLVVYMGLAQIAEIAARLVACGLPPAMPAAAIFDGCGCRQRVVRSTLERIAAAVAATRNGGPTLFVIGRVVDVIGHETGLAGLGPLDPRLLVAAGHA
jgi:uroporphyrin-III C-methyltransferase/precorrin-2 dehydrogenase/sirohydrochlorin ferrochelatase/uroporphyrin-III C-methyltransferase